MYNYVVTKPYFLKLTFRGIKCKIKVEVVDQEVYGVLVKSAQQLTEQELNGLKLYLESEGYVDEAYEHYTCK